MRKLTDLLQDEPVAATSLVVAGGNLAILFGANLSGEQVGGINIFLGALIMFLRWLLVPAAESGRRELAAFQQGQRAVGGGDGGG